MFKVLIYLRKDSVKPVGGPSGYTYNLLSNFVSEDIIISLLPESSAAKARSTYEKLPKFIKRIYRFYKRWKEYFDIGKEHLPLPKDELNNYDCIHFHTAIALFNCIKYLKDYKGKIVLTSHTPTAPQNEYVNERFSRLERKLFGKRLLKKYANAFVSALNRADYIVFPCEEAEEPYFNTWGKYAKIRNSFVNKIRYIPTGVESCLEKVKISKEELRLKYNIPEDAFLICYVGRHNEIKGYDRLKKMANTLLCDETNNVYFIIAGAEGPLKRLANDRWIEIGWTNDPYSIVAASDLFVLPNRETYFDLVLLEVLSIGTKVLLSNTGGNKYFKQFDLDFFYFDDEIQATSIILDLCKRNYQSFKNRPLFLKGFASDVFADAYKDFYKKIIGGDNK